MTTQDRRPFDPRTTVFTNLVLDEIMPVLSPNAWKVLCLALRKTAGWRDANTESGRKESDVISVSQFMMGTGIKGKHTAEDAIADCLKKGYLTRTPVGQSFEYRLNVAYALPPARAETALAEETDQGQNSPSTRAKTAPTNNKVNPKINSNNYTPSAKSADGPAAAVPLEETTPPKATTSFGIPSNAVKPQDAGVRPAAGTPSGGGRGLVVGVVGKPPCPQEAITRRYFEQHVGRQPDRHEWASAQAVFRDLLGVGRDGRANGFRAYTPDEIVGCLDRLKSHGVTLTTPAALTSQGILQAYLADDKPFPPDWMRPTSQRPPKSERFDQERKVALMAGFAAASRRADEDVAAGRGF